MNNFFSSQSTSFLLIMLIIFGLSALIKFAVRLFEMLVKMAFVLIILFLGFKALEFDNPPTHENIPSPIEQDTINNPKTDSIKAMNENAFFQKSLVQGINNPSNN